MPRVTRREAPDPAPPLGAHESKAVTSRIALPLVLAAALLGSAAFAQSPAGTGSGSGHGHAARAAHKHAAHAARGHARSHAQPHAQSHAHKARAAHHAARHAGKPSHARPTNGTPQ